MECVGANEAAVDGFLFVRRIQSINGELKKDTVKTQKFQVQIPDKTNILILLESFKDADFSVKNSKLKSGV